MAKKTQPQDSTETTDNVKFKRYSASKDSFTPINEGDEITGTFLSVRIKDIRDRKTRLPKPIRVYTLRPIGGGEIIKIGSRALLDSAFDEIMDENGGFTLAQDGKSYTGRGIDWITNRVVKFIRGENDETLDGNEMGTYEILVEE